MGNNIIKGLASIQAEIDQQSGDFEDGPKARWVGLKGGQSAKIWFLQEFDEDSPYFDPKVGTLFVGVEHSNPEPGMFKRKALCSIETQGQCFGCEMNKRLPKKGWQQKKRLYVNVLIDYNKGEDPFVAILSQGIGGKSITPNLAQAAVDYKGITQTLFRITRTGSEMNNTSYTVLPLPGGDIPDTSTLELYDLEAVATRTIPYDEQKKFYAPSATEDEKVPVSESDTGDSPTDFEW